MQGRQTEYGFQWGPATVERGFCDDQKGWVTLLLKTKKYPHGIQIYVTKNGKVRVHSVGGEWKVGVGTTAKTTKKVGCCSATQIFDAVCEGLLSEPQKDKKQVLKELILALEYGDWDCQQDSAYWDHPVVQKVMRELHPRWFEDEA